MSVPDTAYDATPGAAGEVALTVRDLDVEFGTARGPARVLRGASLALRRGRVTGIVGESGSGKSTLVSAILQLLPANLHRISGEIRLGGRDLLRLPAAEAAALRGTRLATVFQDPMTALNPVFTVGAQLREFQRARHPRASRAVLAERAAAMLERVGIADGAARLRGYPHEFSGGMRQRVMIAAALLCEPEVLLADEPTTALDPTIEGQIIRLLDDLRRDPPGGRPMAMAVISHSLGLISELCDEVVVLYAGVVVERGDAGAVLGAPAHPYTRALLSCEPGMGAARGGRLASIPGEVPDPVQPPPGCVFAPRCPLVGPDCLERQPALRPRGDGADGAAACVRI